MECIYCHKQIFGFLFITIKDINGDYYIHDTCYKLIKEEDNVLYSLSKEDRSK